MRTTVETWLDAHDTSLLAEWAGLFRLDPLVGVALTAASGIGLVVASPLAWLLLG